MPPGLKVVNSNDVGISGSGTTGVVGTGTPGDTSGPGGAGVGVSGSGSMGVLGQGDLIGVSGGGGSGPGVFGTASGIGVSGLGATGVHGRGTATGVHGSGSTTGVLGESQNPGYGPGVAGIGVLRGVTGATGPSDSDTGIGVHGTAGAAGVAFLGVGVWGESDANGQGYGVVGNSPSGVGWAVYSQGNLLVVGDMLVSGNKFAVIKLSKGDHRTLYCMESPESWFEDFGRARLVRGTARVRLERTFAKVVRTGDYHVFLSPEGLSHGLYVSRRTRDGFEVREQHPDKSTVPFSYRIVARRKDVDAPRFKRVKLPRPLKVARTAKVRFPEPPPVPALPEPIRTPQLEALRKRVQVTKPRLSRRGTAGRGQPRAR